MRNSYRFCLLFAFCAIAVTAVSAKPYDIILSSVDMNGDLVDSIGIYQGGITHNAQRFIMTGTTRIDIISSVYKYNNLTDKISVGIQKSVSGKPSGTYVKGYKEEISGSQFASLSTPSWKNITFDDESRLWLEDGVEYFIVWEMLGQSHGKDVSIEQYGGNQGECGNLVPGGDSSFDFNTNNPAGWVAYSRQPRCFATKIYVNQKPKDIRLTKRFELGTFNLFGIIMQNADLRIYERFNLIRKRLSGSVSFRSDEDIKCNLNRFRISGGQVTEQDVDVEGEAQLLCTIPVHVRVETGKITATYQGKEVFTAEDLR